jgi:acyl carrier protein
MSVLDRETVKSSLMKMLMELREDWEYSAELTEKTGIFRDLGFESIDAVALGSEIEEHFGQTLPFAAFLTRAGEQQLEDITIGNLLDFLMANLDKGVEKVDQ